MDLADKLNQTAVHWETPTPDGFGGNTFATVGDKTVRWEDKVELFIDADGQELRSMAKVWMDDAMAVNDWLYLGAEADLDSSHSDPQTVDGAYRIRQIKTVKSVDGVEQVRMAWL